jgi:hypothetical protein
VTGEPRGVYRTQGENGKPNTALLESGTLGFDITEQEYRDNKYKPDFDDLPWGHEYHAAKKKDDHADRT